jgi:ferrous iron transport protein A
VRKTKSIFGGVVFKDRRNGDFMSRLADAQAGDKVVVAEIHGDERLLGRTASMGMIVGSRLEILRNEKKQPLLLFCRDTMVAVNRRECEKIIVQEA